MPDRPTHHDLDQVIAWLRELRRRSLYGKAILTYRKGEVVLVQQEEIWRSGERLENAHRDPYAE